jgi:hypothetical protein
MRRSVLATREFWSAAFERATKTAAQFAVGILTVAGVTPANIDWQETLLGSMLAALVSVLTSVASVSVSSSGGPSLTSETLPSTPPPPPEGAEEEETP